MSILKQQCTASEIKIVKDYICPFCYIALGEWGQVSSKPKQVQSISVLLLPELPVGGLNVANYDRVRNFNPETRARNNQFLADEAARVGLPWTTREKIAFSRPAHILAKWAEAEGLDSFEIDRAIFEAYYGRGEDIGTVSALEGVAETLGLPARKVAAALVDQAFHNAFGQDLAIQQALVGIKQIMSARGSPSPTLVVEDESERARILGDWQIEQPENMDWSQLRTISLPTRHERSVLSHAMMIIDQWEGEASPWPKMIPSALKFYEFVASSPVKHQLAI